MPSNDSPRLGSAHAAFPLGAGGLRDRPGRHRLLRRRCMDWHVRSAMRCWRCCCFASSGASSAGAGRASRAFIYSPRSRDHLPARPGRTRTTWSATTRWARGRCSRCCAVLLAAGGHRPGQRRRDRLHRPAEPLRLQRDGSAWRPVPQAASGKWIVIGAGRAARGGHPLLRLEQATTWCAPMMHGRQGAGRGRGAVARRCRSRGWLALAAASALCAGCRRWHRVSSARMSVPSSRPLPLGSARRPSCWSQPGHPARTDATRRSFALRGRAGRRPARPESSRVRAAAWASTCASRTSTGNWPTCRSTTPRRAAPCCWRDGRRRRWPAAARCARWTPSTTRMPPR